MNLIQRYIQSIHISKAWLVILLLFYKIALDIFGRKVLCVRWGYAGYVDNTTLQSYCFSWLFCALLLPWMMRLYREKAVSSHILLLLVCNSMIPTASYFGMANPPLELWLQMFVYWTVFLVGYCYRLDLKMNKIHIYGNALMLLFIALAAGVVLYVWIRYAHCRIQLDLFDVYGIRREAREYTYPTVFAYILLSAGCILPLGVLYSLKRRHILMALMLSLIVLCNFSIAGHKSVAFFYVFSIVGYFFMADNIKYFYVLFFLLSVLGGILLQKNAESDKIGAVVNRVLFMPAQLHMNYYDFFKYKEKDYMRQGVLRHIGAKSPYEKDIAFEVGADMGKPEMSANNGLYSDAYSNFGWLGICAYPLMLVFILSVLDVCVRDVSVCLWPIPILQFVLTMVSTTFTTALLSGGLLWIMLFLFSYKEE